MATQEPAPGSAVSRMGHRRWLIALVAAIVLALAHIYALPWHAGLIAVVVFTLGAALIPRAGAWLLARPAATMSPATPEPGEIAKAMIDALPEPAIVLAKNGAILSFNRKAAELFSGLKPGAHISGAIRHPHVLEAVAACGTAAPMQTVSLADRVPVERRMAVTVSHLGAPAAAENPAILLFLRDLTEQQRLDQLRSDFIANASHEIKTPLASLLGFIETLQGAARDDAEARGRFLAIMAKQGQRMARLIDNLMSLSRVEMRAHLKPQDPVPIAGLVEQACDALEPMASEARIEVEIASAIDNASVLGDRDELTQVFINLIHNALKYGKPGGRVRVCIDRVAGSGGPQIAVTVEDDGPGIERQHLPRLTERFYRIPDSAGFEKGGAGLGLAIVKHVVNRHRGELRIASEEGVGSKFTVLLSEYAR